MTSKCECCHKLAAAVAKTTQENERARVQAAPGSRGLARSILLFFCSAGTDGFTQGLSFLRTFLLLGEERGWVGGGGWVDAYRSRPFRCGFGLFLVVSIHVFFFAVAADLVCGCVGFSDREQHRDSNKQHCGGAASLHARDPVYLAPFLWRARVVFCGACVCVCVSCALTL